MHPDRKGNATIANKPFEPSSNLADPAAQSADDAIRSTQRVANEAHA
jgi:hypothetical protein